MHYEDVEPGAVIYWCATCGPKWTEVEKALTESLKDKAFYEKFEGLVKEAEKAVELEVEAKKPFG